MREGGESNISLCYARGSGASRQFFHEVVYVVCVECLYMIKPMVVVLLFENLRSFWEKNCYQG